MTVEIDTVLDRRRLRRRLAVWRTLAVAAVVAALFAFGVSGDNLSSFGPKQIARVAIEGTITEDRQQLELLKRIADADNAAALLVFVNSPGGTTTGGEALFAALREVAKKKPVVAQFGTVAASAGYIVGLGTDHIVTRANTITGSVGVLIQWPEVSQALDKLGVKFNEIKSGDLKAVPSPFEPLSQEGAKVTQTMIDEGYRWFLGLVEQRRGIKAEQIPGLTRGRVFTGREAVQLKLGRFHRRGGRGGRVAAQQAQHRQKPESGRLEAADHGLAWIFQLYRRCRSELFQPHLLRSNAGQGPLTVGSRP